MAEGKLREEVLKERPASPRSGQPIGTMSQMIGYFTLGGTLVARVHAFELPDGRIGGSGQHDPKWLFEEGKVFFC